MRGRAVRLLAIAAAGALSVFGFAPFAWYPLTFIGVAVLYACGRRRLSPGSPDATNSTRAWRQAACHGLAWGLGFFLTGVSWVYISLTDFGGVPAPLAVLATLMFCLYLSLFPSLALAIHARLPTRSAIGDTAVFAACWTLAEWLRGELLSGFPWLALGYAHGPPSPLAGWAPVFGVWGVGFAVTWLSALAVEGLATRTLRVRVLLAGGVLLLGGWGLRTIAWTTPHTHALEVSLLQGNIPQSLKWRPELLQQSLSTYLELAQRHPAQLMLLPETALPSLPENLPSGYLSALRATARGPEADVILGTVVRDRHGRYFNAALSLASGADYRKRHLVPFGEFTPPLFAWTLTWLHIPMSDFARGAAQQPPWSIAGERVAANICYEDIFGAEIRARARHATLLANLSNTAWFGDSAAQPQHLQIAQMRALETGRPMLRATNSGVTAIIAPDGQVTGSLPAFTPGALRGRVHGHEGSTPYLLWGDLPTLAWCGLIVLLALRAGRTSRHVARAPLPGQ